MDIIRITAETGISRGTRYDEYRRLRHRVFVVEQGWAGLTSPAEPGLTCRDPADEGAWFWLAWSSAGALVGAVRVRSVAEVFPHEELFHDHLQHAAVADVRPWMGSLNSLVVDRSWRGRRCQTSQGGVATAAGLLLRAALVGCRKTGLRALVATAQTVVSARALMRAGFRVIDPPVHTHLHPAFAMCNVGIVLCDDERGRALEAYFDARQSQALGGWTIAYRFSMAQLQAAG
jgi:N-acyl-L-homoserine lactone synthetase